MWLRLTQGAAGAAALALGHCGAMLAVAGGALAGWRSHREVTASLAMLLLAGVAWHAWRRHACGSRLPAAATFLWLAAFIASTLLGSGFALVPMLALCSAGLG